MSEGEKKLNSIFLKHSKRAEDKTRAILAEQKGRQQRAMLLEKYVTTVLEPELGRLAKIVQGHGHKAVVYVTGAIPADGTPLRAYIRVVPAGQESKKAENYHPSLHFELSAQHDAINVQENAVFGGTGSSQNAGTFLPKDLTAAKIESLFIDLMARTFKS